MTELSWQKSSFSGGDAGNSCLEVAIGIGGLRHLRESDDASVVITSSTAKLRAFILGAKAGEFDHLI
ncbi:hypothetical protein GCM10018790_73960 [Kitasatospora xanthocidica]|uniref:DUF397 domain-containing protein n=1 Tax=Kitasatospora xanthocidica TaxID=83382 RepID=UPI001675C581|nr:DUF397 domain-containing protein [Kitasatospora xanthocidica]GHF85700.1 hypothetical protein GCM10018790_73960 [Kitasatospora xanthocidica]